MRTPDNVILGPDDVPPAMASNEVLAALRAAGFLKLRLALGGNASVVVAATVAGFIGNGGIAGAANVLLQLHGLSSTGPLRVPVGRVTGAMIDRPPWTSGDGRAVVERNLRQVPALLAAGFEFVPTPAEARAARERTMGVSMAKTATFEIK